jgi:hypothetical protein
MGGMYHSAPMPISSSLVGNANGLGVAISADLVNQMFGGLTAATVFDKTLPISSIGPLAAILDADATTLDISLVLPPHAHPDLFRMGAKRIFTYGLPNDITNWCYLGMNRPPIVPGGGSHGNRHGRSGAGRPRSSQQLWVRLVHQPHSFGDRRESAWRMACAELCGTGHDQGRLSSTHRKLLSVSERFQYGSSHRGGGS